MKNTSSNTVMTLKENLIRTLKHDRPDHVPYWHEGGVFQVYHGIVNRASETGLDSWGVGWELKDPKLGTLANEPAIRSLDDIKHYRPPHPSAKGLFDEAIQQLDGIEREEYLVIGYNAFNLFERSWMLLGMENLLCAMVTDPDKLRPLYKMLADVYIVLTERFAEIGVEAIRYGDDWGTQKALFVKPGVWRDLIKPDLARMYGAAKKRGLFIYQHTDGCIQDITGDLVELGCDCIEPCQPLANDLAMLKQTYGKLTFEGAVDSQYVLSLGTPEEVEAEVKMRIEQLGEGGGYICQPSHYVPFPEENVQAMIDAARKYGKYSYD